MEDAFLLADKVSGNGVSEIDILGGEPLLIPWIHKFIQYAHNSGLSVNLSTNGSLYSSLEKLIELPSNSVNIGFSVLGFRATHNKMTGSDNYSSAMESVRLMLSSGRSPIVKSVLAKENRNEIIDFAAYLESIGIKKYYLLHEDITGRTKGDCISFPEYYEFYLRLCKAIDGIMHTGFVAASGFYKYKADSDRRCDAGAEKLAIMPDGSVFPCNLFAGFSEFRLGNIFSDSLESILNHPALGYFLKKRYVNTCKNSDCAYRLTCTGGCPAHSYFFSGSPDTADPRCDFCEKD